MMFVREHNKPGLALRFLHEEQGDCQNIFLRLHQVKCCAWQYAQSDPPAKLCCLSFLYVHSQKKTEVCRYGHGHFLPGC